MIFLEDTKEQEQVLVATGKDLMEEIGGPEHYCVLSTEEQIQFAKRLVHEAQISLGERAYQQLSPAEKVIVDYWVWSGCIMHKDLNAMKGGVERMAKQWVGLGDEIAPVVLMNKFKTIAAKSSATLEEEDLAGAGDRGGPKLTGLLSSLVKHKETKKGHQECFQAFSLAFLKPDTGQPVQFPDTSNNRYQSHGLAATEILFHLDLYLTFLWSVADSKPFNHLKQNVEYGLCDPPTCTELAVMSLYSQSISVPFSLRVRFPNGTPLNSLDLGPDYDRIKRHMESVINNLDLLLGQGVSHEVRTLYREEWVNRDVIKFIRGQQYSLPHLQEILIAFFQGTLKKWKEFAKDICNEPKVTEATPDQRYLAFRHPTNDLNEGALGLL